MNDVSLSSFDDWYSSKIKDVTQDYVKEVEKVIKEIEHDIKVLTELLDIMISSDFKAPELSASSARRLGEKIKELINEYLFPPVDIKYDNVDDYISRIDKFSEQVLKYGKIWVPQLTRHYKQHLKKVNYFILDIAKKKEALKEIQRNNRWVKELELVFSKAHDLRKDLARLKEYNEKLNEFQEQLKKIQESIDNVEREISELKKQLRFDDLQNINQQIEDIRQDVISLLNIFQKAFKKLIGTPSANSKIPPGLQQVLSDYSEDAFSALMHEEVGHPKLNQLLRAMQRILEEDTLSLKSSDIRRIQKKIQRIIKGKNDELKMLQEKYLKLIQEKETLTKSGSFEKLAQLDEKKEKLEKEKERILFKIDNLMTQKNEREAKIRNLKQTIENLVKDKIGEEINLVF